MERRTALRWLIAVGCLGIGSYDLRADEPRAVDDVGQSPVVVITVKAQASPASTRVTLGDVAELRGGTKAECDRLRALDLVDRPGEFVDMTLGRAILDFRLQLAGLEKSAYRLEGAEQVHLTLGRYLVPETEIIEAAKQFVRTRLAGHGEDVAFVLTHAVRNLPPIPARQADIRLECDWRSSMPPIGKVRIDVAVLVRDARYGVVPVHLDVKILETVAVSERRIERGEPITTAQVSLVRRSVDRLDTFVTPADLATSKRAKYTIQPGQALLRSDIESPAAEVPILVKQQSMVKLVARLGDLQVTAVGEAMQDGRAGQRIRVRNVDSQKIVQGRVVDRSVVEVDY